MAETKPRTLLTTCHDRVGFAGILPNMFWLAPTHGAAERIADAVNSAWNSAWAAETLRSGHGHTGRQLEKALSVKSDPALLEKLEMAARKPEHMERSEWFTHTPWQGGVYEVTSFVHHDDLRPLGFARYFPERDRWSNVTATVAEAADAGLGGSLKPCWRGINEAQARALGVCS